MVGVHGVWLCDHESLSFSRARELLLEYPPEADQGGVPKLIVCNAPDCKALVKNHVHKLPFATRGLMLHTQILLFEVKCGGQYPQSIIERHSTKDRMLSICENLRLPICCHRKLKRSTGKAFHARDILMRKDDRNGADCTHAAPWADGAHRSFQTCRVCSNGMTATASGFVAEEVGQGDECVLRLHVELYRDLGNLENDRSPGWKYHADKGLEGCALRPERGMWRSFKEYLDCMIPLWSSNHGKVDHSASARQKKHQKAVENDQRTEKKAAERDRELQQAKEAKQMKLVTKERAKQMPPMRKTPVWTKWHSSGGNQSQRTSRDPSTATAARLNPTLLRVGQMFQRPEEVRVAFSDAAPPAYTK